MSRQTSVYKKVCPNTSVIYVVHIYTQTVGNKRERREDQVNPNTVSLNRDVFRACGLLKNTLVIIVIGAARILAWLAPYFVLYSSWQNVTKLAPDENN
jgi:hypothetical protein